MVDVYICPRCRRPVGDNEEYIVAREYQLAPGWSPSPTPTFPDDYARGAPRRFHPGHFTGTIGKYVFRLEDDSTDA